MGTKKISTMSRLVAKVRLSLMRLWRDICEARARASFATWWHGMTTPAGARGLEACRKYCDEEERAARAILAEESRRLRANAPGSLGVWS